MNAHRWLHLLFCELKRWKGGIRSYFVTFIAASILATILPYSGFSENTAALCIFAVMIASSWSLGIGPAMLAPLTTIGAFYLRQLTLGVDAQINPKQVFDLVVITAFTTAVGIAGTLRRRSQAIAEERARQLLEQDRRKDEFLATLAHELRNPLAPVRTGLEVLRMISQQSQDNPMFRNVHEMMQRQVDHMVRLIDDLLDVSRINTGKIEIRKERVALQEVIDEAVEASRPQIESNRHQLSISVPDTPVMAHVDRARLAQVLTNLLNNSSKFTEPDGHLWLTVTVQSQAVEISVRDNGIGMSAETLPKVFEMFAQAENLLTRSRGGLGIGLSLVKRLIELHGGTVEARSAGLGQGSEFVLRLPLEPTSENHEPHSMAVCEISPLQRRILIVDDNQDAAHSLALMLSARGHCCQLAFSGPAALQTASEFQPDVFLLDIGMPGMSGLELAAQLRQQTRFQSALLIAITGWGQDHDRERSLAAGFNLHLVKPVKAADICQLLNQP